MFASDLLVPYLFCCLIITDITGELMWWVNYKSCAGLSPVNTEGNLLPLTLFLNAIVRFLKQTFLESNMITPVFLKNKQTNEKSSWHINTEIGM